MIPPDSRQTIDRGMATGAALTQSSNPLYHCNLGASKIECQLHVALKASRDRI